MDRLELDMGYRLRNKELQKKLDEISDGDFSEQFKKNMARIVSVASAGTSEAIHFGKQPELCILIKQIDLECTYKYSPKTWNAYPDVKPPEGVWMRTEMRYSGDPDNLERKLGAVFLKGKWRNSDGYAYPDEYTIKRFRPWED